MIITANANEFIIDGTTIPTREIRELRSDASRILLYHNEDQGVRTLPTRITYSLITSYNGSTIIPAIATMVAQMQGYIATASSGSVSDIVDPVNILQTVVADTNNSSATNLAAGNSYTFTGVASSTLGVAGIQVSLFSDKNCTVLVQQSPDGTNWDLSDSYKYYANGNFGITVQAISSYVRVVVSTASLTTTAFRLQTALCPIVEVLPRSLDEDGHLQTVVHGIRDEYDWGVENTPMGEMRVSPMIRLVGSTFDGTTIDSNFWTSAASGTSAAIAQANAQILLTSGTSNAATVTLYSFRRGRYVGGSSMRFRASVQLGDTGTANNRRRWGVGYGASLPTITDGAYFQLDGTEFSVNTIKGASVTKVTSFNGNLGTSYTPTTNVTTYEIYWTNGKVYFVVGDEILHTVSASTATWSATMSLHCFADSLNSGVLGASVTMAIRVMTIYRMGQMETAPIWRNINTTAVTALILKRGPGRLHHVNFNTIPNTTIISIYDALSATNPICIMNPPNGATPFTMNFDCDFYTGLTITTTPNAADITVVWE